MRLSQAFLFSLKDKYIAFLKLLERLSANEEVEILDGLEDIHISVMNYHIQTYPFSIPYEKISEYVYDSFTEYISNFEGIDINYVLTDTTFHDLFLWNDKMEQ